MSARQQPCCVRLVTALVAAGTLALAGPAAAQQPRPGTTSVGRVRPRAGRTGIGFRAYGFFDANRLAATRTFGAVLGTDCIDVAGGGGEVLRLWKGLFLRVDAERMRRTGSRVFVFQNEAISLGIPLTVEMQPLALGAGWRLDLGRRRAIGIYGGTSYLHLVYRETSSFAAPGENTDETYNGYAVFGGADVTLWQWIVVGAEAQYRSVPNAIGTAGVSQAFGETDLGGTTLRVLVGVRH